jgi:hypothetical protein
MLESTETLLEETNSFKSLFNEFPKIMDNFYEKVIIYKSE